MRHELSCATANCLLPTAYCLLLLRNLRNLWIPPVALCFLGAYRHR
jgi:hypothetical protein